MEKLTTVQTDLLRAAAAMAAKKNFDRLLYVGDLPLPEDIIKAKSMARRKLVQAVSSKAQRRIISAMQIETVAMPIYDIPRTERIKMALVAGIASGIFSNRECVVALSGRTPISYPDTLMTIAVGDPNDRSIQAGFGFIGTDRIPSAILQRILDLAVGIARDGWEGHPLGTLLAVGDSAAVMEKSRQLTLNPFQGYSEHEKNILNPAVCDAIRNFAVLDGGFVIRSDGVVLAAGRYIKVDEHLEIEVPLGLGSRHVAACGISKSTKAIAIVVSETTGMTRIFQSGECVLAIAPESRLRGPDSQSSAPEEDSSSGQQSTPSEEE